MKTRERYWGLYDYTDGTWLADDGDWSKTPVKRSRFERSRAIELASDYTYEVVPRPFYVTRRPRLPAEAQAIIDAARAVSRDIGNGTIQSPERTLSLALKRYDEATK